MRTILLSSALAASLLTPSLILAQAKPETKAPAAASANAKTTSTTAPTAKEIADAKAKGLVWVDTKTGVYHKSGRAFGKSAEGKFMTEADAKAAGYHAKHQTVAKHSAPSKTVSK